jgi:hypothetical protein
MTNIPLRFFKFIIKYIIFIFYMIKVFILINFQSKRLFNFAYSELFSVKL